MGKEDSMDKFWDIEELLPSRPVKKPMKMTAFPDTDAVEVAVAEKTAEKGAPIPMRRPADPREKRVLREYTLPGGFVQKVTISPWPTEFSFYTKFRKDAIRYFEREHEPCEYVYFFSYMPQYDQMTASQLSYYLYWRGEIRKGVYIKTDINYLFLYAYEIINLPDRIPPKKGAVELSRLWAAYRDDFLYLDKYLGEWLCDYCLIHKVEPDWVTLDVFAGAVASKVSMPEFYLHGGALTWALVSSLTAYDYTKSKYYPDHEKDFDLHIPQAVEHIAKERIAPRLSDYGIEPVQVLRDSFSGAVACHDVKFKIAVICTPLRRSLELKQTLTGIVKLCENNMRAVFGIKSRFVPNGVSEELKLAVSAYFDGIYPERNQKKKKSAQVLEEERYMALYEPENKGPADISRALEIEAAAWETAELLDTGEDDAFGAESISFEPFAAITETDAADTKNMEEMKEKSAAEDIPTQSFGVMSEDEEIGEFDFLLTMEPLLREALMAATEGNFDRFCRSKGKMAETVCASINEIAMDAIGDIILEDDFSLVSDYMEDILSVIGKN